VDPLAAVYASVRFGARLQNIVRANRPQNCTMTNSPRDAALDMLTG
jgi:hypothetical protein